MSRGFRCVLVADDAEWAEEIEVTLRGAFPGMKVRRFTRALAALAYLRRTKAHAIIADVILPEVHGLLFAEAVRELDALVPIFLAANDDSIAAEALQSGANAFLNKRTASLQLVAVMEQVALMRPALA